eukprot:TRINITY_DN8042_c0_g1_i3.p1 TRINITY_DN8042_c0_g1~~TRINITY_DN8042_c0_g1_i3.p1  ORF type:complete len:661 (+),score=201.83 TRINITY_DN8042_c0_g1_i3:95-1984(+)
MPAAGATGGDGDKNYTILESIELSDESDEDFKYEELPEDPDLMDEEDETLDDINRLLAETQAKDAGQGVGDGDGSMAHVQHGAQVIDDYFRNYLTKNGMRRSLENFQSEWYEMQQQGRIRDNDLQIVQQNSDDFFRNFLTRYGMKNSLEAFQMESYELQQRAAVPEASVEVLLLRQDLGLSEEVQLLRQEIDKARQVAAKAKHSWDKFRKERDFHRMHHRRVVQEKNRLIIDLKRLKKHYEQYEPTLTELRHKYEVAMKEKMLTRLERDRFVAKAESLQKQLAQAQFDSKDELQATKEMTDEGSTKRPKKAEAPWPEQERHNPYAMANLEVAKDMREFKRAAQFKGHQGAISRLAFHPKIPVVATASDDHTWKMWSMPDGQLVLSGEGHRDWVSGVDFHPRGSLVATTSGDFTTKLWDVTKESCKHTFKDHNQAVWSCSFHDQGDFLVSCSMDHTAKAYDLQSMRCRQTFRGHVDSVNYVTFQPYSSNVLTASGDKTISLWDLRLGLCVQTFYGHNNACNHATFNLKGDTIVSCDSDGLVKMWDVRVVSEFLQIDTGNHPANSATFDRSGKALLIASGDASVKAFNVEERAWVTNHVGHEDSVQDVAFEPSSNKYFISASSDSSFSLWQ